MPVLKPRPMWTVALAVVALAALVALVYAAPRATRTETVAPPDERAWVDQQFDAMTMRQKAAQLIMVRAFGQHRHPESPAQRALVDAVERAEVGGIVVFDSDLASLPRALTELQTMARTPLLVASDFERSAAFRVRRGTVDLPYAMALGATGSEPMAEASGAITAREARALGIHWIFAPVADVNSAPTNPVIGIRAYGENPEQVAALASAFIRGARRGDVLTTVKHFPGHGDTTVDSHKVLPTVAGDRTRLDAVELKPFRAAIDAGVDTVMLGHLSVPALDDTGTPSSLSRRIVDGLLRQELGFDGLVATDAIEMKGVGGDWPGIAVVQAVAAGADVVLLPPDHRVAIDALTRAVADGTLPAARLDEAARRVLEAKARLGLHRQPLPDPDALRRDIARPEDVATANDIAAASITLVRDRGNVVPLHAERAPRVLHLTLTSYPRSSSTSTLRAGLAARNVDTVHHTFGPEVSDETHDAIVDAARDVTHVLVSALFSATSSGPSAHQKALVRALMDGTAPVIVVSLGSPYLLGQLPDVPVYLCSYGSVSVSQRAVVAALFGEADVTGTLPVSLPGLYPRGHGLTRPRRAMTLVEDAAPSRATDPTFDAVDRLLDDAVTSGAFPGGVVAIGQGGRLLHHRAFGRMTHAPDAAPVARDTLYDLASLTKVIATTTMTMMLVDDKRLILDARLQSFLPGFAGSDKADVTLRHLLTHSAGLDWWAPLYETLEGPEAYRSHIERMDLVAIPGTTTRYSDLGLILLGAALERAAGKPLDAFVRARVFGPLGMDDTQYNPPPSLLHRIAPTEVDTTWRDRLIHGEVHDENARALGGVAPHAGLFGTARDLARFAQMLLNGGVFEHRRLIQRDTVDLFTRRARIVPDADRALGWDTKSAEGSSAGTLFSARSFGHTGFTGTSMWLDPERDLFVILLTNRVHPTRENKRIREIRPALADAVVRALED